MHPISFLQKRAHLSAVARGQEMFVAVPAMTPARFDILYLIHENHLKIVSRVVGFQMAQADVRRKLGLSRQTVSKMVKRLVELGLIKKTRMEDYHRHKNLLELTEEGVRRTRQAFAAAFTESLPLPLDAPADGVVPRYFRRLAEENAKEAVQQGGQPLRMVSTPDEEVVTAKAWAGNASAGNAAAGNTSAAGTSAAGSSPEKVSAGNASAENAAAGNAAAGNPTVSPRKVAAVRKALVARRAAAAKIPSPFDGYAAAFVKPSEPAEATSVPEKFGREVEKIFTGFAWVRARGGRRGRRWRHLELLSRMIDYAQDVAQALGDTSELIYRLGYETDH